MATIRSVSLGVTLIFLAAQSNLVQAISPVYLSPDQDIVLPASSSAKEPLKWAGANSPYFAGPNVNGITNEVPDGCIVEQAAYAVRHGSRYPDSGAYAQWTDLYSRIQAANFTASGSLDFVKAWEPVLTNPIAQIAQESPSGYKEAYDLGYRLRTKYPNLYAYGTPFISWANLYPRVVQTAQNFVRGFLGATASASGTVITVNSTGSINALFDSLSPSDQCPLFVDGNGGTEQVAWNAIYLLPILARLETMIDGDFNFTTTDVGIMPYLCGFESQITGTLSPWCGVFTDVELLQYEYAQDLRYYYGMGPGTDLPSKIMLPFVNSLAGLLQEGPGVIGTLANGSTFTLPNIITAFMNDGQITEVGAAIGVWDGIAALSGTRIPADHTYIASHFVSMRGTVAFERLNCSLANAATKRELAEKRARDSIFARDVQNKKFITSVAKQSITSTIRQTLTYNISTCTERLRHCTVGELTTEKKTWKTTISPTTATSSSAVTSSSELASMVTPPITATASSSLPSSTGSSNTTVSNPDVYIRILLNDAVYPVVGCASGPGSSCQVDAYKAIIEEKLDAAGDLVTRCNVTSAGHPTKVKGASFFTDLSDSWLASIVP